jgi:hypothetical protein
MLSWALLLAGMPFSPAVAISIPPGYRTTGEMIYDVCFGKKGEEDQR